MTRLVRLALIGCVLGLGATLVRGVTVLLENAVYGVGATTSATTPSR